MVEKRRGLGRGLDALLKNTKNVPAENGSLTAQESTEAGAPARADNNLLNLPLEFIQPGRYQPRLDMRPEALEDLANSIKAQGLMQPIVVRQLSNNKYEIIAGERRWRASQIAGLDTIPVIIKQVADEAVIAMALIENIQREDLNPIEEAMALKRLQDEFELTQQEVADAVGKSRTSVTNLIRLMSLKPEVRTYLERGDLEMGHARALLGLKEDEQSEAARSVVGKGLSVRQTEALVRRLQAAKNKPGKQTNKEDPDIKELETSLSEKLGTQVLVQHSAKGKGRLILKYNNLDQLDGILAHIK